MQNFIRHGDKSLYILLHHYHLFHPINAVVDEQNEYKMEARVDFMRL